MFPGTKRRVMSYSVSEQLIFICVTSQTKEALFTILRDLRPDDRFNFVSFSSKIKVWQPARLVPVTPLTVRDAKKFIFTLMPTGGESLSSSRFLCSVTATVCLISTDLPSPPQAQTSMAPSRPAPLCFVVTSRVPTPAPTASPSLFS